MTAGPAAAPPGAERMVRQGGTMSEQPQEQQRYGRTVAVVVICGGFFGVVIGNFVAGAIFGAAFGAAMLLLPPKA